MGAAIKNSLFSKRNLRSVIFVYEWAREFSINTQINEHNLPHKRWYFQISLPIVTVFISLISKTCIMLFEFLAYLVNQNTNWSNAKHIRIWIKFHQLMAISGNGHSYIYHAFMIGAYQFKPYSTSVTTEATAIPTTNLVSSSIIPQTLSSASMTVEIPVILSSTHSSTTSASANRRGKCILTRT